MNLIVDINPFLVKNYEIPQFSADQSVQTKKSYEDINEGAINSFRILNMFDVKNRIFTFLGGSTGSDYLEILKSEVVDFSIYKLRDKTVEKLEIHDKLRKLSVFTNTPRITNEEFADIYSEFSNELHDKKFIILTDANGVSYEEEAYGNLINMAYKAGIPIGISVNKDNIKKIVEKKPYLLVLDKESLEEFAETQVNFNWEINKVCKGFLESGVGKVLYYNPKGNLQLFTKDFIYTTNGENISFDKDYKDRILAGYVAAYNKNYEEEMRLSIALASTGIELKRETLKRDTSQVKTRMKNIEVEKINA